MNILIVAATWLEVKLIADELEFVSEPTHLLKHFRKETVNIDMLITGIGTTFTAFHLTTALRDRNYDLVINAGIAGSLCRELQIGEVVFVVSEEFADLGIEKEREFLTLFDAGFIDMNEFPFENGILKSTEIDCIAAMKKVKGITTNKSHGRLETIAEIKSKYSGHIETMEGAAVFYVCKWIGVDCCQIRAISNYVEPRESSIWNIPLAIESLKDRVLEVLNQLVVEVN